MSPQGRDCRLVFLGPRVLTFATLLRAFWCHICTIYVLHDMCWDFPECGAWEMMRPGSVLGGGGGRSGRSNVMGIVITPWNLHRFFLHKNTCSMLANIVFIISTWIGQIVWINALFPNSCCGLTRVPLGFSAERAPRGGGGIGEIPPPPLNSRISGRSEAVKATIDTSQLALLKGT